VLRPQRARNRLAGGQGEGRWLHSVMLMQRRLGT
jgi:hypothetical protein